MTAPEASGAAPAKICVACKRDCSGRPRTRDAKGQYICGECLERLKALRGTHQEVTAPGAPDRAERPLPPPSPPRAQDEDIIPLAGDDGLGPAAAGMESVRTCAHCSAILARTAVICTACGYDTRTGHVVPAPETGGRTCISCGYSLRGLKGEKCPECGADNSTRGRRAIADARTSRDTVRQAYTKPLIMFGVGLAISIIATILFQGSMDEGLRAAAGYLIKYAIYVPIGVIVYFACCMMWLGFDAPMHLIALRLAAVYAVTDAVGVFVGFIPIWIVQIAILVIVYVGLLQDMLELDLQDAVLVGIITFGVRAVLFLFLMAWVSGLLN